MKEMWDQRYAPEQYVYGTAPNLFFADSLEGLTPGILLLPGEGEGRNAAHALRMGWQVDAFDQSVAARHKAMKLAGMQEGLFTFETCDLKDYQFRNAYFDAVALIFFHVPPPLRSYLHARAVSSLKPGGKLILQAFHTSQLGKGSGGPQDISMLMDKKILEEEFSLIETTLLKEGIIHLEEGLFHQGEASVINYVGIKK